MANLGVANASYYADNSISRLNRQVNVSVEKVSSNKANITNGDKSSLVSMDNAFKLDLAATNAAVKNMSVAQAYLSTAISTLDNASAILRKIHELAVMGANGSNSDADNAAINIESEALIDAFHKSMTVAQFKGKEVFTDDARTFSLASGGQSNSIQFGVGKVDYDILYDYTNPGLTSLSSGVKYEIRRDLSDAEKTAILSRSSNLTAEQLVKGFQFTTDAAPTNNIGDGTITVNPNGTNVHNYAKGSGVQRFDANATANGITADFKEGFLELEISENYELSDNLSVRTAGNITVTDGVVFFTDPNQGNKVIEIGKVDDTKNGLNGTTLRINFHHDATIPGTSDLKNGDFDDTINEVMSYRETFTTQNRTENRDGFISAFEDAGGNAIAMGAIADADRTYKNVTLAYKPGQAGAAGTGPVRAHIQTATTGDNGVVSAFNDAGGNPIAMGAIAPADRDHVNVDISYKAGQAGTAGSGTVRVHIQTDDVTGAIQKIEIVDGGKDFKANEIMVIPAGNGALSGLELTISNIANNQVENITNMEIIDGGKDFKANEILVVPAGNGNIAGDEITITGVLNGHTHTLTAANTNNTTANATWGDGESGFYDFDASGAPAVGGARLAYSPGQNKLEQVVTKTMVPNPAGVIIDPETGQRTNDVEQTTFSTRIQQIVTGSTYLGETNLTEQVSTGYTPDRTDTVPEYWSRHNKRVDFGQNFTLDLFPTDAIKADPLDQANELDAATGTVDTSGRAQISVPTPTEAQMAATADGSGNDNAGLETALGTVQNNMRVQVNGGKLNLNTSEFWFTNPAGKFGVLHGPAAVSDVFSGKAGQFLKLDYTATGTGDDYHVAGYIYKVNPDGSPGGAPIIALNETGTAVDSRASVEIPDNGDYRFVFVVGTYDKTGGRKAGADMTIDNIVAEDPYTIGTGAISDLLKAVHFENNANAANPNKTLVAKVSNKDGTTVLTDDALINMQNFALTSEPDGPYMLAPTLNFTTQPSEGGTGSAVVLTKKIEVVQDRLNLARTQAGSQYGALEEAIDSTTDLRSQFALGSGTLSDLNFSIETVNLTRRQMQQDVASSVLAQANKTQSSLVSLVDGSYRTYLNAQFAHLK